MFEILQLIELTLLVISINLCIFCSTSKELRPLLFKSTTEVEFTKCQKFCFVVKLTTLTLGSDCKNAVLFKIAFFNKLARLICISSDRNVVVSCYYYIRTCFNFELMQTSLNIPQLSEVNRTVLQNMKERKSRIRVISHFWITSGLFLKASPGASVIWKYVFYSYAN